MPMRFLGVFADLISITCFLEEKPELNDYEKNRLKNIREMAKEKKKFEANLKASAKALKQALKKKSQAPRPLVKCDFCKRTFQTPNALTKHKRTVHKAKPQKFKSEVYFECMDKTCSEKFKTYNMIKKHIEQNHTFTCSACNESFKTKYKEKIHNCFPFLCDCGKKFKTETDMAAHNCHKCKYCDELFPTKHAVLKHQPGHYDYKTGKYESHLSRQSRQESLNIWA